MSVSRTCQLFNNLDGCHLSLASSVFSLSYKPVSFTLFSSCARYKDKLVIHSLLAFPNKKPCPPHAWFQVGITD